MGDRCECWLCGTGGGVATCHRCGHMCDLGFTAMSGRVV